MDSQRFSYNLTDCFAFLNKDMNKTEFIELKIGRRKLCCTLTD